MSVMLTSSDMAQTIAYYRDVLGFEMKESWPDAENPQWANMVFGGQSVMVGLCPELDDMSDACAQDPDLEKYWREASEAFKANKLGVGVQVYVQVSDVDAFHDEIRARGAAIDVGPKTQVYGIRDFGASDPDGYRLVFFTPITLESCQSCGR